MDIFTKNALRSQEKHKALEADCSEVKQLCFVSYKHVTAQMLPFAPPPASITILSLHYTFNCFICMCDDLSIYFVTVYTI